MIAFRHNTKLGQVQPATLLIVMAVADLMRAYRKDCIIQGLETCGKQDYLGIHSEGLAADFRLKHFNTVDKSSLVNSIRNALGDQFQVIHENVGMEHEFLHVHYNGQK